MLAVFAEGAVGKASLEEESYPSTFFVQMRQEKSREFPRDTLDLK